MSEVTNPYDDLKDEFLAEAAEHLDHMENNLLLLEKHPESMDKERIADIFRAVHSIKGAAGFMGYRNIAEISHIMETLFQMMRDDIIHPESSYVSALLAGVDTLRTLLDDLSRSDKVDIRSICRTLTELIAKATSPSTRIAMETRVRLSDTTGRDTEFEISRFALDTLFSSSAHLYILTYNLHEIQNDKGLTPVTLVRSLLENGQIVETKIETHADSLDLDLSSVPLSYLVLYATNRNSIEIESSTGISNEHIRQISRKQSLDAQNTESIQSQKILVPLEGDCLPKQMPGPEKPSQIELKDIENRAPDSLETVRVKVDVLDRLMELAGELVLVRNQQMLAKDQGAAFSRRISQRLDIVTTELQETIMRTRMQPLANIFAKLPRIVRDLSVKLSKQIEIIISGSDVELDKAILETLTDPLIHIIRNACDHGIEPPEIRKQHEKSVTGRIFVDAFHEAGQINIRIRDDGKGIAVEKIKKRAIEKGIKTEEELMRMRDKDILSLTMLSGFTTTEHLSDISGRGVGMDVVKTAVEQLGGSVEIETELGKYTIVHLRLPLTLAIIPCLIVICGAFRYAIPQVNVAEVICLYDDDILKKIEKAEDQEVYRLRNRLLPMVRLEAVLKKTRTLESIEKPQPQSDGDASEISLYFAVVKFGSRRFGLIVDSVIGTEEIVVKPMHPALKFLNIYSGATVMGDGRVALILDVEGIATHAGIQFSTLHEEAGQIVSGKDEEQAVLLFKSGMQEQFAMSLPMIRRIEKISTDQLEKIGEKTYVTIDGISTLVLILDQYLKVSSYQETAEPFLLLPKHIKRPFGILMSGIIDIAESPMILNTDAFMADGMLGTAIIRDHTTLFIDVYRLVELAEPDWFADRKKLTPPPEQVKRILLVEDTPFFRQLVKGYLEADQYEVISAEHGKEAINLLHQSTFDLIVSDLEMPVMNGWTFLKHIRSEKQWQTIPAVALTALDSEPDRQRAWEAGFNAYEIKIDRERLLASISNLLCQTTMTG